MLKIWKKSGKFGKNKENSEKFGKIQKNLGKFGRNGKNSEKIGKIQETKQKKEGKFSCQDVYLRQDVY